MRLTNDLTLNPTSYVVVSGLVGGLAALVLCGVPLYLAKKHDTRTTEAARQSLIDINSGNRGEIFTFISINNCTSQGFTPQACQQSRQQALTFAYRAKLSLDYPSAGACAAVHGRWCRHDSASSAIIFLPNFVPIMSYIPESNQPLVVGWQAASEDITRHAVPLYGSPSSDQAQRFSFDPQTGKFSLSLTLMP